MRMLLPLAALGLSGCALTELTSPQTGSCSSAIDANQWPKFESTDGEAPVVVDDEIGWTEGKVAPDFELVDQFGDPTCLWQMTGKYVVLDASALWCEPCKQIAETVKCVQETVGPDLVYMTFITQDATGQPATAEHATQWSDAFGLGEGSVTPVIADGELVYVSDWPGGGNTLPTLVLLDQDLRVVRSGLGAPAELQIREELERLTGVDTSACTHE